MSLLDFVDSTKRVFAENPEGFTPHFFVSTPERTLMVPATHVNGTDKKNMLKTVEVILAILGADEYYFVIDTWAVERDAEDLATFNGKVSEQPDRSEALVVTQVNRNTKHAIISKYTRSKNNEIIWDAAESSLPDGMVDGAFTELLLPRGAADNLPASVKEAVSYVIDTFTVRKGNVL